jgi:phenylacetate-CoA ligase
VFKANLPVREAQIIQETLDLIRVNLVPAEGYTEEAGHSIAERIRERMGVVEVVVDRVPEIPRGANGKFRAVVCRIPMEERPQ